MPLTPGQYDRLQQWIASIPIIMAILLVLTMVLGPLFVHHNAVSGTCKLECEDSATAGEVLCRVRGR